MPLEKGETYVVSCVLKADRPDVPARIMVRECERNKSKMVSVGTQWQRFSMTYTADHDFAWAGVGPDLKNADLDAATLWIDAVQFEKADTPSEYRPRSGVESHIETSVTGNTFLDPARGISVRVAACNSTGSDAVVQGTLTITDFFDKQVHAEQVSLPVRTGQNVVKTLDGLVKGDRLLPRDLVSYRQVGSVTESAVHGDQAL